MTEVTTVPSEGDVPVNPYSLMESVNQTSEDARTGWFVFIGLMAYLLVAVAGIGHKELLLSKDVALPILQVSIDLQRFFVFAPIALCFLHFGMLAQHAMLARKVIEFDTALKALEPTNVARHPLRLELHSYFFTQALAGPTRAGLMNFFLQAQSWLTLVGLPVLLLLYIQVTFLPYHDLQITWTHRFTLLADIILLVTMGFFLIRLDTSFWSAFARTLQHHPLTFVVTTGLLATVACFALFIATVPGEALDKVTVAMAGSSSKSPIAQAAPPQTPAKRPATLMGWVLKNVGGLGLKRNLDVMDANLVDDKGVTAGQVSVNLRHRDLRNARLDRSDLHQADLTGANLDGATLTGADLRAVSMSCLDIDALNFSNRAEARCTSLRGADLTRAKADGAKFEGADLTDARFESARLDEADFSYAILTGVTFIDARARRANFTGGIAAQGANFLTAQMQGADLTGADLLGADFSSAGLQGTIFKNASLIGVNFLSADMDASDLSGSKLWGADFSGARLPGTDVRQAFIWQVTPPSAESLDLADLTDMRVAPPQPAEISALATQINGIENADVRSNVQFRFGGIADKGSSARWQSSDELTQWRELTAKGNKIDKGAYRSQLTSYLGSLMCRARWSNASVATGIVKRALVSDFRANSEALYNQLLVKECPASEILSRQSALMRDLSAATDGAKAAVAGEPGGLIAAPTLVNSGSASGK